MKKAFAIAGLLVLPLLASAEPGDRAECILEMMPGVKNDIVADAVIDYCKDRFYGSKHNAKARDTGGQPLRSVMECLKKYAFDTENETGVKAMRDACEALYPKTPKSALDQ